MRRVYATPVVFLLSYFFVFGWCAAAMARQPQLDPRDMSIDRAVGGMEVGSRIAHPRHDGGEHEAHQKIQGTGISGPGKEAHATAASGAQNLPHSTGIGTSTGHGETHPVNSGTALSGHTVSETSHAGTGATGHHAGVSANGGEQAHAGAATGSSQTETGGNQPAQEGNHGVLIGGNLGSGEPTRSETANRSIVEADTSTNLSGENPSASGNVSVDTNATGGLLDVNAVTNAGTVNQQLTPEIGHEATGGSSETAGSGGSNYIIEADANLSGNPTIDVTLDTTASGGLLDANAVTNAGTVNQQLLSESSHETSSTSTSNASSQTTSSEGANRSIIEADTNVNVSGGSPSVEANISIDPNASGGLLDLNNDTSVDTIEQELTSTTGLEIGMGVDTINAESELGTEFGTSDAPPTSEAETGLQADVEGIGAGEDLASDPADGLSSGSTLPGL